MRDEQIHLVRLAGRHVDHGERVAGPVDEHLVAGHVHLPRRRRQTLALLAVLLAVARVAMAVGPLGAVLVPLQHQRYAAPLQLLVDWGDKWIVFRGLAAKRIGGMLVVSKYVW